MSLSVNSPARNSLMGVLNESLNQLDSLGDAFGLAYGTALPVRSLPSGMIWARRGNSSLAWPAPVD